MKKTTTKRFASLRDAYLRAISGEEAVQRCIIGCLENLGCEQLADGRPSDAKWRRSWRGMEQYIGALVGEYGESEVKAEKGVLAELNAARGYCDDVQL